MNPAALLFACTDALRKECVPLSDLPITLISVRRSHGRATLTLSTGEVLVMPRAMLKERPYRGGMPFDADSFHAFMASRAYPFALEKAAALLALRSRTKRELRDALRLSAYPEEAIERVLARMEEAGYLDDADFAGHWATSRSTKGMGARRIRMELHHKGVDRDTIEAALSSLDEQAQFDGALKAARKASNGKDPSNPRDRQKVIAALLRRGYDYDTARRALAALQEEAGLCPSGR